MDHKLAGVQRGGRGGGGLCISRYEKVSESPIKLSGFHFNHIYATLAHVSFCLSLQIRGPDEMWVRPVL